MERSLPVADPAPLADGGIAAYKLLCLCYPLRSALRGQGWRAAVEEAARTKKPGAAGSGARLEDYAGAINSETSPHFTVSVTSSRTNEVCREVSSLPVNLTTTV